MMAPLELFLRFEASASTPREIVRCGTQGPPIPGHDLKNRVAACVRELRGASIQAGDVVFLEGLTGVPFVVGVLACWACDAVVLTAEPQLSLPERQALRRAFLPRILLREGPAHLVAEGPRGPAGGALPDGTAVIKLSSGSTGSPRGIAVTAASLLADTEHLIKGMNIGPEDLNIGAIPLSHSYGMDSLLMPLVLQGSPLLLLSPLPEQLAPALAIERPAVFPGVPYFYDLLARSPEVRLAPQGLKTCLCAGALLKPSTARAFRSRFGLPVRAFYGSSETGGITYDASPDGLAAESSEGCVGTPLPGVEVLLEEEGRVVVRGANVASGYVGGSGDPANGEFKGETFRTGDLGRIDAPGLLHLTGRLGSLVNVSGRKVNPREVEAALLALPGVWDAAVLGIPDAARGESLLACLVARAGMTREEVMTFLRERVAAYKLPRRILFLPELPRSERGKLDRRLLLRQARLPED
jgi:acyl-CoA synthetase (AMP-forming)/AMP-acid ligase II